MLTNSKVISDLEQMFKYRQMQPIHKHLFQMVNYTPYGHCHFMSWLGHVLNFLLNSKNSEDGHA